ncbi:hypothetical protein TRFO_25550 [Tritrichomonas foetus]|uniref:Uncharacterized protein n=1 Tax=Tritrichomonas foetus TaxID=1144522 RepID=A0A1J4K9Q5_9EUKA|nr:hypothetical protein TRFO_25550 [Tritrichomonas foetus]|eukprot:OHT06436.1 hypothetical protein TRFO_25550 [Tritrichomonas foetus]
MFSPKCDDQRLENLRMAYERKNMNTDKEFFKNFIHENIDTEIECDDDGFIIEPFELDNKIRNCRFNSNGTLVRVNDEDDSFDLAENYKIPVQIEEFTLTDELRYGKFDDNENYIPLDSDDSEIEEEEEEENFDNENDGSIIFDKNVALESMRILISVMNRKESVSQVFMRFKDDPNEISILTTAASQLQFMGLDNIYMMKRKEILSHYNNLLHENQNEN